jgi:hypothetical protein
MELGKTTKIAGKNNFRQFIFLFFSLEGVGNIKAIMSAEKGSFHGKGGK